MSRPARNGTDGFHANNAHLLEVHPQVPQGLSAELIAEQWKLRREDLDAIGYDSQMRALRATEEGRFENEIVPVPEGVHMRTTASGNRAWMVIEFEEEMLASAYPELFRNKLIVLAEELLQPEIDSHLHACRAGLLDGLIQFEWFALSACGCLASKQHQRG